MVEEDEEVIRGLGKLGIGGGCYMEDNTKTSRIYEASTTVTYFGSAAPGSSESSEVWKIIKMEETGGETSFKFPNGKPSEEFAWDQKLTYTYE